MSDVIERAREEVERGYSFVIPGGAVVYPGASSFIAGATFAATITPEQVEAAARAIFLSDRGDTARSGFFEEQWDELGADNPHRPEYTRRALAVFTAAGFQIGADDE